MAKKIIGGLVLLWSAYILFNALRSRNIFSLIPIALYIFSGIFLILFDGIKKHDYMTRLKKRGTQNALIIVLLTLHLFFAILTGAAAVMTHNAYIRLGWESNFMVTFLQYTLPYFIPAIFYGGMMGMYLIPLAACKKQFNYNAYAPYYFNPNDPFYSYSEDGSVLANSCVIFFPNVLCAIPFNQIASTKLVNAGIEKDITFNLTNGKKVSVPSGKYTEATNAINTYRQRTQTN